MIDPSGECLCRLACLLTPVSYREAGIFEKGIEFPFFLLFFFFSFFSFLDDLAGTVFDDATRTTFFSFCLSFSASLLRV